MAVTAGTVWEVQSGGSANNGGGFDPSYGGTDATQTTSPLSGGDLTLILTGTGTTATLSGWTGSSTDLGHVLHVISVTSGTATVGDYIITGATSTTWTFNSSIGTAGAVIVTRAGGCKNAPVDLITTTSPLVAGNKVYCKGAQTLTSTTDLDLPAVANVEVEGYTTTRGDGSRPTWTASGSAVTMVTVNSGSATGWLFKDIIFDGYLQTTSRGTNLAAGQCSFLNCRFKQFTNNAATSVIVSYFQGCEFLSCTTQTVFNGNTGNNNLYGCRFASNTVLCYSGTNASRNTLVGCLWHDNTGASTDGIQSAHAGAYFSIQNCTIDGCGRHGINLSTVASIGQIANCLLTNNGGYGVSTTATNPPVFVVNCAYYSNTSGETTGLDSARVVGSVTLTGDPYNDRSSDDYRLNNTSGAGAACRAAGYPSALNTFATSRSIGAFDVAAGGGGSSGGLLTHPGMGGGVRG